MRPFESISFFLLLVAPSCEAFRSQLLSSHRVGSSLRASSDSDIIIGYLETTCGVVSPKRLDVMVDSLEYLGLAPMAQTSPKSLPFLHPLVIPIAQKDHESAVCPALQMDRKGVVGLLRWPKASLNSDMPVVFCDSETGLVSLLANKVPDFVRRLCCETDFLEIPASDKVIERVNKGVPYEEEYEAGSVKNFARGLDVYCILRVAAFPSTYRALVQSHKDKGDVPSALITCEKAVSVFGEFGELHAFQALLLKPEAGYDLEARDAARAALARPLWTMGVTTATMKEVVNLAGKESVDEYARDLKKFTESKPGVQTMTPQEIALDKAAFAMDCHVLSAFSEESGSLPVSWTELRAELADLYVEGSLPEVASLVRGD